MTVFRHPGTVLTDHWFTVPLDHDDPHGTRIEVYAREVVAADQAGASRPWLLYLQGGPGFGSPRPIAREGWLDRALEDYRVLLLDQRGTGRSTPANRRTLAEIGGPRAQADHLAHFRADAIVRDAELIRRRLTGDRPWSVLGQSFGGFCAVNYLSVAPEGLDEVFITGGLPGLRSTADDYYRATYPRVAAKTAAHYDRYPGDIELARRVAGELRDHEITLPNGGRLTIEAFQSLGRMLGTAAGSHQLHYLLEDAFDGGPGLSDAFLVQVGAMVSFAVGPLYAVLHEACLGNGSTTRWAAERIRAEFPEFDAAKALDGGDPLPFTGEMIYPWMLETDPVLRPLRSTAELLAERDWPRLYDEARLRACAVPVAAAIYHDDMYVPYELSMGTAAAIGGLRPWVTNEYEHDGLRVGNGAVFDRLVGMARGTV
jgi:pimeloyl-ACP methyl ester carboxylesterase